MPTTPSWKSGSNTQIAGGGSSPSSNSASAISSACSRMPPSMSRRSRLMPSSVRASSSARAGVVGQQAFDAQRHVGQPAGGVDARAQREAEVEGGGRLRLAAGGGEQAGQAAGQRAGADALRPCATRRRLLASSFTTSATVPSATSGSSASSLGCVCASKHAARAQFGAQRQQHVEHHAHAGDRLALEAAARLVRVDDHVGVRQLPGRAGGGRSPAPAGPARWPRPRRRRWRCRCPP